jgi:hypothetical protein
MQSADAAPFILNTSFHLYDVLAGFPEESKTLQEIRPLADIEDKRIQFKDKVIKAWEDCCPYKMVSTHQRCL